MFRDGLRLTVNGAGYDARTGTFLAGQALVFDGTQIVGGAAGNLVSDRTVYCNSSTGNDSNAGTQAAPFQTLSRAWTERLKYDQLFAKFRINLIGAGPYAMPLMGASICGNGGYFIIAGDTAAETIAYSGTFTGNLTGATNVVNTSAGMGADTHKGKFVRITGGALAGTIFQIVSHTDTSMVVNNKAAWSIGSTANGDTFQIFLPGTAISTSVGGSGQPNLAPTDWVGGVPSLNQQANTPQHIFFDVIFTVAGMNVLSSSISFIACQMSSGATRFTNSRIGCGNIINGFPLGIGTDTQTNALVGAGIYHTTSSGMQLDSGSFVAGCIYTPQTSGITVGFLSGLDSLQYLGGRIDGLLTVNGGLFEASNSSGAYRFGRQCTAQRAGQIRIAASAAPVLFQQTLATCLRALYGGQIYIESTAGAVTGGTTAAAGLGSDASDGGLIIWKNQQPSLTGGTAGVDLKVNTGTAANAALAANGNALTDVATAGSAQSQVARVA